MRSTDYTPVVPKAERDAADRPDLFGNSWISRGIVQVIALKLAGLALIFDPSALQAFDFPKSAWSRGTEWILAGLLILSVLRFGAGVLPRTSLHASVVAYALAVCVAGLTAVNAFVALHGEQDSYLGLTFVGDMLILYLAAAVAIRHLRDWRNVASAIAVSGVIASAYAIAQFAGVDPLRWSVDPQIRPFSTFGNPNQLAHFLSIATGISIGSALFEDGKVRRGAYGMCACLFVVTTSLTGARASVVSYAVVATLTLAILARRRLARPAALALFAVAAVGIGLVLVSPAGLRLRTGSIADRALLYGTALEATQERPVAGFGPDLFEAAFIRYRPEGSAAVLGEDVRHVWAHDWVLQALVTTGLVGATALAAVFVFGSSSLWTRGLVQAPQVAGPLLLGWGAYWSHAFVTVSSITVDWFPWLALGTTAALIGRRQAIVPRATASWVRGGLLLLAMAGAIAALPAVEANREAGDARSYLAAGFPDLASKAAEGAIRLDAGRAVYWNWLGIATESLGRWDEAISAYEQAAARADYVPTFALNLARAKAQLGLARSDRSLQSRAFDDARRALALDPYDPALNQSFAQLALLLGRCDAAFGSLLDAYSLAGSDRRFVAGLADAAGCVDDIVHARARAVAAVEMAETGELRAALAVLFYRAGDTESARSNARRALEFDSALPAALRVLELIGP